LVEESILFFMRILGVSTIYVLVGLTFGVGSAMYSLSGQGLQDVPNGHGWQEWRLSPDDGVLPYSLGHFQVGGQVPPPKFSHYYIRTTDDDGNRLSGDCIFVVEGSAIASRWWSLSAGVESASVLSAGEAVLDSSNKLKAVVSRHPMPGNWIVPPGSGSYTITYVVSEPTMAANSAALVLPTIKKVGC
jgi:hypothetical protein